MYIDRETTASLILMRRLHTDVPTAVSNVARELGIQPQVMQNIARKLRARGLIRPTKRGALRHKRWREITLADIIIALKGERELTEMADDFVKQAQQKTFDFYNSIMVYNTDETDNEVKGCKL